jgi:hypothetical protein
MRNDQGWFLEMLDDVCHRKGFSRPRSSEQGHFIFPLRENLLDLIDRSDLISGWLVGGLKFEHE